MSSRETGELAMPQPAEDCRRRRWSQFSLRTLLILVAAGAASPLLG
jgi:hypothetical protein